MRIERIQCDCCGAQANNAVLHWESRATHVKIECPPDGINGGQWSMDVCSECRKILHDTIRGAVDELRQRAIHDREFQIGIRSREKGWG